MKYERQPERARKINAKQSRAPELIYSDYTEIVAAFGALQAKIF